MASSVLLISVAFRVLAAFQQHHSYIGLTLQDRPTAVFVASLEVRYVFGASLEVRYVVEKDKNRGQTCFKDAALEPLLRGN